MCKRVPIYKSYTWEYRTNAYCSQEQLGAGGRLMWTAVVSRVEKVDEEVGMNGEGGIEVCRRVSEVEVY